MKQHIIQYVGRGGTEIGFGASVYNSSFVLSSYLEQISVEVKIMNDSFGYVKR